MGPRRLFRAIIAGEFDSWRRWLFRAAAGLLFPLFPGAEVAGAALLALAWVWAVRARRARTA